MTSFENFVRTTNSGARICLDDSAPCVIKYGNPAAPGICERLREQARFMQLVGTKTFPDVHLIFEYGYLMEKLDEVPDKLEPSQAYTLLRKTQAILAMEVWGERKKVLGMSAIPPQHELYMLERAHAWCRPQVVRLQAALMRVRRSGVTRVDRTHGDPTLDNVMRRTNGHIVLTDPIPATLKVPALAAVDLGKMLQSAWGYEVVNAVTPPAEMPSTYDRAMLVDAVLRGWPVGAWDTEDTYAAYYFLAVHILRLLPYQPAHKRQTFINWLDEIPL